MAGGALYSVGRYRLGRLRGDWVVTWDDDGGVRRRYRLRAQTQIEARAEIDRFAQEQGLIRSRDASQTVGAIWEAYIADRRLEGRRSVEIMEYNWKALAPAFAHLAPPHVTKRICIDYAEQRRAQGRAEATILTELRRIRTALQWAEKAGLIERAPQVWLPAEPRANDRWLTEDEVRRLIDGAASPHIRLYLVLAVATAGRPEAILQLTWDRIDFDAGLVRLDDPARERTAKGRATVPINSMARAALAEAREAALTQYVIEYKQGPVLSIKKGFAEARRRAGIEHCTPRDLRRTAASWMVMAGVPLEQIARYLGHTTVRMTERVYGRFSPSYLKSASEAVNLDLRRIVRSAR